MSSKNEWRWSEALQSYYVPAVQDGSSVCMLEDGRVLRSSGEQGSLIAPSDQRTNQPRSVSAVQSSVTFPASAQREKHIKKSPHKLPRGSGQGLEPAEALRQPNVESKTESDLPSAQEQFDIENIREFRDRNGTSVRFARGQEGEILLGTEGEVERLDPAYRKRSKPQKFFLFGKMFTTLWTEPSTPFGTSASFSVVRYGTRGYAQIRRFVVIREGENYCYAAPVVTYGGQGVAKPGVVKHEHAIIFSGSRPQLKSGEFPAHQGERPVLDIAIQVDPVDSEHALDPMSRINLGAIATIQHNLKVKPYGMVRNLDALRAACGEVTWRVAPQSGKDSSSSVDGRIQQPLDARRPPNGGRPGPSATLQTLGPMLSTGPTLSPASFPNRSIPLSRSSRLASEIRQQRAQRQEPKELSDEEDEDEENEGMEQSDESEELKSSSSSKQPDSDRISQPSQHHGSQKDRALQQRRISQQYFAEQSPLQPLSANSRKPILEEGFGRPTLPFRRDSMSKKDVDRNTPRRRHSNQSIDASTRAESRPSLRPTVGSSQVVTDQSSRTSLGIVQPVGMENFKTSTKITKDRNNPSGYESSIGMPESLAANWHSTFVGEVTDRLQTNFELADERKPEVANQLGRALISFTRDYNPDLLSDRENKGLHFIRKRERNIVSELLSLQWQASKERSGSEFYSKRNNLEEWLRGSTNDPPLFDKLDDLPEHDNDMECSMNENDVNVDIMKALILGSVAFDSFIRKAQAIMEGKLSIGGSLEHLNETLAQHITDHVQFIIDWDPVAFMRSNHDQWREASILDTIAVTRSSENELQALTCAQYLLQTWPSTGPMSVRLLRLLIRQLMLKSDSQVKVERVDIKTEEVKMRAQLQKGRLAIEVESPYSFALDFGAQLAWLGAACRHYTENRDPPTLVQPRISAEQKTRDLDLEFSRIFLDFQPVDDSQSCTGRNTCWTQLFRGLSVVNGFPTSFRTTHCEGLEMTLELMMVLGETPRAVIFDGRLVLKGYSAMFVATRKIDDGILWHLLIGDDEDEEISYGLVSTIKTEGEPNMAWLECNRHFVGWADNVQLSLGTTKGVYTIRSATSQIASARPAATSATLSVSKIFGLSTTIIKGKREALQLNESTTYRKRMHWLGRKQIVVYDELSRQMWLQGADRVLLHLLRCRILENYAGVSFFSENDFSYANRDVLSDVTSVLLDPNFYSKKLDEERSDPTLEVEKSSGGLVTHKEIWKILVTTIKSEIIDLHDDFRRMYDTVHKMYNKDAIELRGTTRPRLEGWSFREVVSGLDNIPSRVIELQPAAEGWIDLCNTMQFPILIGGGFGDLISPSAGCKICPYWTKVPTGQDYLAAPVHFLGAIQSQRGDSNRGFQITNSSNWHQSDLLFETCSCRGRHDSRQCNRVQDLYSDATAGKKKRPTVRICEMPSEGAVIFGRSSKGKRLRQAAAGASRESLSVSPEADRDSGMGTSISSSGGPTRAEGIP